MKARKDSEHTQEAILFICSILGRILLLTISAIIWMIRFFRRNQIARRNRIATAPATITTSARTRKMTKTELEAVRANPTARLSIVDEAIMQIEIARTEGTPNAIATDDLPSAYLPLNVYTKLFSSRIGDNMTRKAEAINDVLVCYAGFAPYYSLNNIMTARTDLQTILAELNIIVAAQEEGAAQAQTIAANVRNAINLTTTAINTNNPVAILNNLNI